MTRLFKSIRWRLQLWYGLILVMVLAGFGFTAYQLEKGEQFRRLDQELSRRAAALSSALVRPPRDRGRNPGERGPGARRPPGMMMERGEPPEERERSGPPPGGGADSGERFPPPPRNFELPSQHEALFDATDPNVFYYVFWNREGAELARSATAPEGVARPHAVTSGPGAPRTRGLYREMIFKTPPGEVFLVGGAIEPQLALMRGAALKLAGTGGVILLLGLAGGWWIATRAIRPIDQISAAAVKIAAGELSERIKVEETENELGRLAAVLNSTFSRLETAFAQQEQFTSDAAHELRTPVSVILTQTQTALKSDRTAPEYKQTLEACHRAAKRMRHLIESLLELARLDTGDSRMTRIRFHLRGAVAECMDLLQPLAEPKRITMVNECADVECEADQQRMSQVITNLLTNAVLYNREGGEVRVTSRRDREFVEFSVSDTGVGIAPEHLPRLFERFYRVDAARTSSKGRSGLGLAICKAIVEAHGGGISVSSRPGEGTTFSVRLPLVRNSKSRTETPKP